MITRILIVDDNSVNLYMLESLLKGYGIEVTSTENGKDALDKARLNPPDLIVSDILMPIMDGYTLCRQWKSDEQLKHIPFVFYTATYTEPKDEDFALSLGADKFIIKPQEPDILINMIKEFLEEKYNAKQMVTRPLGEEMEFFRQHNEILFKKLEKKMLDLEIANKELKEFEKRYRLSFENASDVIYMIDTDLNVLSVSPNVERILGYKPQELIGRPVTDLENILMPESFEQAVADVGLILNGETISATIYRFIAKDGTIKYGEVSGSPTIRDGKIIGMISIARDITRRKLAEDALRESEAKYRELVKYAPAGIYEIDYETGCFTSVNDIICEYTGYSREELLNTNIYKLLTEESQKLMSERLGKLFSGEEIPQQVEYCIRTKGGEKLWILLNARYIYEEGKLKGATGIIYNISERKRSEEKMYQMNTFLDSIIENIPNMLFLKDAKDLRFVRFNRAGEDLLGYSRDDLLGKSDYDFFPKEQADSFTEKDRDVLRGKEVVDIPEEPLQTRNKGERILHTKKVPILGVNGEPEYLLGISEDITERKQAEEQLKQSLERLNRAVGTTIQVMVSTVETRDPYTAGHQKRSADLARAIAEELGLSQDSLEAIWMAGSIHDIGKLSIPAEILSKPAKLSELEYSLIKQHPRSGYEILKDVESSWPLAEIVYQHHERIDGSGYPRKLKGDEILIEARILAVADVCEAMASHRPYRAGLGIDAALNEIEKNRGIFYDDAVADACLRLFREKGFQLEEARY
ncbi:MAG: PAS domain S-box protein [Proteobacteria bacterium]|nr:PAS domain S-box protein [Pseudomonadota bacterium]